jgi:hypothetical protein
VGKKIILSPEEAGRIGDSQKDLEDAVINPTYPAYKKAVNYVWWWNIF